MAERWSRHSRRYCRSNKKRMPRSKSMSVCCLAKNGQKRSCIIISRRIRRREQDFWKHFWRIRSLNTNWLRKNWILRAVSSMHWKNSRWQFWNQSRCFEIRWKKKSREQKLLCLRQSRSMRSSASGRSTAEMCGQLICCTVWPAVEKRKFILRWSAGWSVRENRRLSWFLRLHWRIRQWCGFTGVLEIGYPS